MKKLVLAGVVMASALALTACDTGNAGYSNNGGWSSSDWDMNNPSMYNNNTYCQGGTYQPLTGNQYSCFNNGTTTRPSPRPSQIVPPKTQQAAPKVTTAPKQQGTAPKQNTAPKPAPKPAAPKPAPKTGK